MILDVEQSASFAQFLARRNKRMARNDSSGRVPIAQDAIILICFSLPDFAHSSLISTKMRLQCDEITTKYDAVVHFYDSLDTAGLRAGTLTELPGYAAAYF
jgi:hypothetical protein